MNLSNIINNQHIWESILKILKYLRPKFYNRITWIVVFSGLTLISSSLLEKVIERLFEITFNINVTDGNDSLVGLALVIVGLLYHLIYRLIELKESGSIRTEYNEKKINHDIKVYNRIKRVVVEDDLNGILDWINRDHSYVDNQWSKIESLYRKAGESDNAFISDKIDKCRKELIESLNMFLEFLATNFFECSRKGDNSVRHCLYPDLNIDRCSNHFPTKDQMRLYDEKAEELDIKIINVRKSYINFRLSVKNNIWI